MAQEQQKRNIVIIGGGIIGSTTAYFLSHHEKFNRERDSITLLEATKIAGGASGKAGGLLAKWAYPSCIVPLSYRLHQELASTHAGSSRWDYRGVNCGQLDTKGRPPSKTPNNALNLNKDSVSLQKRSEKALGLLRAAGVPDDLDWVQADGIAAYDEMGDPSTTAQVHPFKFTTSMADLAEEKGVKVVFGSAKEVLQSSSTGSVEGVKYTDKATGEEKTLEADTVVLTAGPWTPIVWPKAPISALRAHSVTITPSRPVSAYALFTSIDLPKAGGKRSHTVTPEIYARPNNEVYACGEGDQYVPLPASTDLVEVDEGRCQDIVDQVTSISEELRDGEVTVRQACYLPNATRGGGPYIGETKTKGLFIGAGHTCWGIQNAPGTGKVLSEMIWDGKAKSADLSSLDPKRFM
ncbi:FAD dependent oxidoreductase [Aaosphaeria arxii CBS 175.79]|uniref:FAD dependent oxidoreductase n=1 Tax=Aaosphaeria arxii CBS 175.79 TaxID=1450172 RepID=A0A6A5XV06_9PLEO|nr:FAD dependent oxidoreductase [Aaosphaeria arxii CBS 175.79]KAF2016541.1 FAD dependent oxidoreductase [Aaosphaeria arxii CBS 175.79]